DRRCPYFLRKDLGFIVGCGMRFAMYGERGRQGRPDETLNPRHEAPMIRLLTRLFGTRTPAAARPARRVALSVEALETRETPSGGLTIGYEVSQEYERSSATRHIIKEIEKRNTLTAKNLSPGNYSVSYHPIHVTGDKILSHHP